MAHYILNSAGELRERVAGALSVGLWGVDDSEPHRNALAAGDLALIYLGRPTREFIGRAELDSAVHAWTPSEADAFPGDADSGVVLAHVEEWQIPVQMDVVLARLAPSPQVRADFDVGVVLITEREYETVLAVAGEPLSES